MRIRGFSHIISQHLQKYTLNDTVVVIDAYKYFYNKYSESGLPFVFGSESDRFADYIREDLTKYKNANVKCYFVFKGSIVDVEKYVYKQRNQGRDYVLGDLCVVEPMFAKEICKQVLEDMGFDYVVCESDFKTECVALARKFACPIISYDIEFCFTGVNYIPFKSFENKNTFKPSIVYDESTKLLTCKIFILTDFLKLNKLTKENFAIFVMLKDENIFPNDYFMNFFKSISDDRALRYEALFRWLSNRTKNQALRQISDCITTQEEELVNAIQNIKTSIFREVTHTAVSLLYFNKDLEITVNDPLWFEKGAAHGHIAVPLVNLYKYKVAMSSEYIKDNDQENSIVISLDIMKYAYDLLTNFSGEDIYLWHIETLSHTSNKEKINFSIAKPNYDARASVFENGWNDIGKFKLFHHFIQETLQIYDFSKLDSAPSDSRLLIIALIYFARRSLNDTTNEVYSIILCYVMLNVVFEKSQGSLNVVMDINRLSLLDSSVDISSVTVNDCVVARDALNNYFTFTNADLLMIFDKKLLDPLVQFQHCLNQMNYLNTLCGKPFKPTQYKNTYNGSFVYRVLYHIKHENNRESLKNKLKPAASVLAFFSGMIDIFEDVMYLA